LLFAYSKQQIGETTVLKNGFLPSPSFRKLAGKARPAGFSREVLGRGLGEPSFKKVPPTSCPDSKSNKKVALE